MNLFLVGMMGTGKSHWAKKIAHKHALHCIDLDQIIETAEGKTIPEIFATFGEKGFRAIETKLLRSFEAETNFIMATGGGAACFDDNMEWMNQKGVTIWLDATPAMLVSRLEQGKADRPLLKDLDKEQMLAFLTQQLAERTVFYQQAIHKLPILGLQEEAFKQIIEQYA